ncbi:unnamed protein product [Rotaria sordida]|uniref:Uncharacterized protein n=1 Tax=Rotaria sordida TaxID=392033 RepID=A0A818RSM3_9BILA|nr:unnamed protein product [Rotaria sordida]
MSAFPRYTEEEEEEQNIFRTLYTHMADHNIELTEKGHKQAIETGKNITLINWSRIYLCLHEQEFGNLTDTNTNIERT